MSEVIQLDDHRPQFRGVKGMMNAFKRHISQMIFDDPDATPKERKVAAKKRTNDTALGNGALVARYAKEFPDAVVWYEFEPHQIKVRCGSRTASVDLPVLEIMPYIPFEAECLRIRGHLSGH